MHYVITIYLNNNQINQQVHIYVNECMILAFIKPVNYLEMSSKFDPPL